MHRFLPAPAVLLAGTLALGPLNATATAQSTVKRAQPGFNLFTVQQDVEIGQQSAIEAEKQLTLLNDANVNSYLNQIVARLAAVAPGARYPYHIKAVRASAINAFSLPGGPMYVNTGLIAAARSESELAGVLAHEMAHVALRHGTHQASNAYLAQAGLGILGGLLGRSGSSASQIVNTVGGLGLNVAFLKFSRDYEYQADATGADIMARAGYDPVAMADFFALLRQQQGRDPSKVAQILSDHPSDAAREQRIRQLASSLTTARRPEVGGFAYVRSRVGGSAIASSAPLQQSVGGEVAIPSLNGPVSIPAPSARFIRFAQPNGFFTIQHPSNWRAYPSGYAVSIAPDGGVVDDGNGRTDMVYGVIINHYAPFQGETDRWSGSLRHHYAPFEDRSRARGTLEDATDDLIRQILSSNSYLSAPDGSAQSEQLDGWPAYSVVLSGRSPVTGENERVTATTRSLPDGHVIYALCIAPSRMYNAINETCTRMLQTLMVNDEAAHRADASAVPSGLRPPD
jgi:Zn-dependent protease with chaperone function